MYFPTCASRSETVGAHGTNSATGVGLVINLSAQLSSSIFICVNYRSSATCIKRSGRKCWKIYCEKFLSKIDFESLFYCIYLEQRKGLSARVGPEEDKSISF